MRPDPGEKEYLTSDAYASHRLGFEFKRPTESETNFLSRVANKENPEEQKDLKWTIGSKARTKGSIHRDMCEVTAAELMGMDKIAVLPKN